MGLASEHKTGFQFGRLEREIALHAHRAFQHPRAAGGAHTRPAGLRHVQAGAHGGGQDVFVARREWHFAGHAVAHDAQAGLRRVARL